MSDIFSHNRSRYVLSFRQASFQLSDKQHLKFLFFFRRKVTLLFRKEAWFIISFQKGFTCGKFVHAVNVDIVLLCNYLALFTS